MSDAPVHPPHENLPHDGRAAALGAAAGLAVGAVVAVVAAPAVIAAAGFAVAGAAIGGITGAMAGSDTADELDQPPPIPQTKEPPHA